MKYLLFAGFVLLLGCRKTAVEQGVDLTGYKLEPIEGSNAKQAVKRDGEGKIIEEGTIVNGKMWGTWLYYEGISKFPRKIVTYVDGIYNGPYFELGENGQIQVKAIYKNNKLNGEWGKYSFSRPLEEGTYVEGKLDGVFKEYNLRDGKIIKETNYSDGVLNGPMRFYNEKEEVTVEYIYKNGEKIGGGMKNPGAQNQPK